MFELEKELDVWRRELSKNSRLSSEVADELESHLLDSFEAKRIHSSDTVAFQDAVNALGDSLSIAQEFEKADILISIKRTMKNIIIGSLVASIGLVLSIVMMGGKLSMFFHPAELFAVLLVPVGITITSFGMSRFLDGLRCICSVERASESSRRVLHRWASATYITGALVFIVGLAYATIRMNEPSFGFMISASFSSLIYSIVIAELFLRSASTRIEEYLAIRD